MNTFYVKIEAPKNVNLAYLNANDIQAAFNNFFQQNQHILGKIFETLGKTSEKPGTPINQEQVVPTAVINPAQAYTDTEWDKLYSTRSQTKLSCHFDDRRNLKATKDFSYRRNDNSPNCERAKYIL